MLCCCLLTADYLNFWNLWHKIDAISWQFYLLQYNLRTNVRLKIVIPIWVVCSSIHINAVVNTPSVTPLKLPSWSLRCSVKICALQGNYAASSDNFLPTFRNNPSTHLQGSTLGTTGYPEKSARYYHYSPRNDGGKCNTQMLRGGNLKSRTFCEFCHM
jgi:hypothetical protein